MVDPFLIYGMPLLDINFEVHVGSMRIGYIILLGDKVQINADLLLTSFIT